MRADRDVLAHGQAGERLHDLERARDAAPASRCGGTPVMSSPPKRTRPRRREEAGDDREQRGLAGAVRADQRADAALLGGERGAGRRASRPPKRCETFSTRSRAQPWRALRPAQRRGARGRRPGPAMPRGANATTSTSTRRRSPDRGRGVAGTSLVRLARAMLHHQAPSSGPHSVPMPPTIGASSASTEIHGP